jgi:hypothetical protein
VADEPGDRLQKEADRVGDRLADAGEPVQVQHVSERRRGCSR